MEASLPHASHSFSGKTLLSWFVEILLNPPAHEGLHMPSLFETNIANITVIEVAVQILPNS